jgi:hypothetical protein
MVIKNAIITGASITSGDHDVLSAWLHLSYGGTGQSFGGYTLYLPKNFKNYQHSPNFAGHFIYRVLQVAGVEEWSKLEGKAIRVKLDTDNLGGLAYAIGHILNEDWFEPKVDFAEMLKE